MRWFEPGAQNRWSIKRVALGILAPRVAAADLIAALLARATLGVKRGHHPFNYLLQMQCVDTNPLYSCIAMPLRWPPCIPFVISHIVLWLGAYYPRNDCMHIPTLPG